MASAFSASAISSSSLRSDLSGVALRGLPPLCSPPLRSPSSLTVTASAVKKIKTKEPNGPSGDNKFRNGVDASGRKSTGKGVYQYTNKYGANVDGYSPIYAPDEWSATGDVYAGGPTGLVLWAITLGAVLLGGVLLVYNTSALAQ